MLIPRPSYTPCSHSPPALPRTPFFKGDFFVLPGGSPARVFPPLDACIVLVHRPLVGSRVRFIVLLRFTHPPGHLPVLPDEQIVRFPPRIDLRFRPLRLFGPLLPFVVAGVA